MKTLEPGTSIILYGGATYKIDSVDECTNTYKLICYDNSTIMCDIVSIHNSIKYVGFSQDYLRNVTDKVVNSVT